MDDKQDVEVIVSLLVENDVFVDNETGLPNVNVEIVVVVENVVLLDVDVLVFVLIDDAVEDKVSVDV